MKLLKIRVVLTLGGEQVIKTHASTVKDLLEELDIAIHSKDYIHPSLDSKVKDEANSCLESSKTGSGGK